MEKMAVKKVGVSRRGKAAQGGGGLGLGLAGDLQK